MSQVWVLALALCNSAMFLNVLPFGLHEFCLPFWNSLWNLRAQCTSCCLGASVNCHLLESFKDFVSPQSQHSVCQQEYVADAQWTEVTWAKCWIWSLNYEKSLKKPRAQCNCSHSFHWQLRNPRSCGYDWLDTHYVIMVDLESEENTMAEMIF